MSRWYGGALLLDEFEIRVDGGFILEDCASIKIQVRVRFGHALRLELFGSARSPLLLEK